jgi:two-component system sensor histidine kinase PilS (NtrC family)
LTEYTASYPHDRETFNRYLKWLMSGRFLFALLLLGSTIVYQFGNPSPSLDPPFFVLYIMSITVVLLSGAYALVLPLVHQALRLFVYFQIGVDTLCVTVIIFVTGGYASVFSFLNLLVIIYSSVFVFRRGTYLVATLCCLQYALVLFLESQGYIDPYGYAGSLIKSGPTGFQVFQKCTIMTAACFAVAVLSGYLSDQERRSKADLAAMEVHLERVQRLAQIGELAAGLAHEIKNPLASLSGAIQILKSEIQNNPDNMRLMHIVLRETERLSSLVNNFLTFARPSAGHAKRVNLEKALAEIVTLFEKDSSFDQRISLSLTIVDNAHIEIDPLQFRQVIWNLLLNGAESIENQGHLTITVIRGKGGRIVVEIADDGCGMDPETVQAIFNPFFTTKTNGTGLGLSIVYRILETYDCRMDVTSTPGRGSTFSLLFKTAAAAD